MAHLDPRRDDHVTASDVPSICGENGYPGANGDAVMRKKVLRLPSQDTPATLWGKQHEPIAIKDFCDATGAVVEYPGFAVHPRFKWLGGTIDGKVRFQRGVTFSDGVSLPPGAIAILEVKCPKSRAIKDGEMPGQYVGQVQTYLEIYDCEDGVFLDYKPAGPRSAKKMMILHVKRDREYMALRLPFLKNWWDRFNVYSAYVTSVVTVIQRAWRLYLARRAFDQAAREKMMMRLGCASTVGKIAGFLRKKHINETMWMEVPECTDHSVIWTSFDSSLCRRQRRWTTRPDVPIHTGVCVVSMVY